MRLKSLRIICTILRHCSDVDYLSLHFPNASTPHERVETLLQSRGNGAGLPALFEPPARTRATGFCGLNSWKLKISNSFASSPSSQALLMFAWISEEVCGALQDGSFWTLCWRRSSHALHPPDAIHHDSSSPSQLCVCYSVFHSVKCSCLRRREGIQVVFLLISACQELIQTLTHKSTCKMRNFGPYLHRCSTSELSFLFREMTGTTYYISLRYFFQ